MVDGNNVAKIKSWLALVIGNGFIGSGRVVQESWTKNGANCHIDLLMYRVLHQPSNIINPAVN